MQSDGFVHLHLHSEYSLLDGACKLKELVREVKNTGQKAVAVTDHGNMYGAVSFYREAIKNGIKPIIGCEVYVAPRSRFNKESSADRAYYHLVLLCKNNTGYRNLVKLVTAASLEGFYIKPRIDFELLEKYHEGLICLSGCLAGEVPQRLLGGDYINAKKTAARYLELFGKDNYYIELQDHGIIDQKRIIPPLVRIADELGINLAATNDVHYIKKEDAAMQQVLMCIQTNKKITDDDAMSFETEEFYLKSAEQMSDIFSAYPKAVSNTVEIAEKCNVSFEFGKILLPKFTYKNVDDTKSFLRKLCFDGMRQRYGGNPSEKAVERLEYELSVISDMGYTDYYLIVWDFVNYARSAGIPVGMGRGSGAGSICAYCIGITGIDPIKHDLLFERFLNPERVSMPDFDIDFCVEGRKKVKEYVIKKYGAERVSDVVAFDTLKARAALRDVGRTLDIPFSKVDKAAKLIPHNTSLTDALKNIKEFSLLYDTDHEIKKLVEMSLKLEDMPRHISTHASAVVIAADPITDLVPLQRSDSGESAAMTQYAMDDIAELGLLKFDFLGLRNLTVINDCVKSINRYDPEFDIEKIPLDDKEVYDMLSEGDTIGVFQMESDGLRKVLQKLRPENIEDIIAVISLYRPGPMDSIPLYIKNRHNKSAVKYKHPLLEPILNVTYGCIVYQEQVMEICRRLAGYSYGRADLVRRAMAKKKADVMEKERDIFLYGLNDGSDCTGAIANGVPKETANEIFDEMSGFASYAFNKSHAASYAYLAYRTAYLKKHYYLDYMAALMNSVIDSSGKIVQYLVQAASDGVRVLPPDINKSYMYFTKEGKNIRFGLLAVKGIGKGFISRIISSREKDGPFKGLEDFCTRMQGFEFNKKAVISLIKAGSMDNFPQNRRELLENLELLVDYIKKNSSDAIEGQLDLFGNSSENSMLAYKFIRSENYDDRLLLEMEKEVTGIYISGNPADKYRWIADLFHAEKIAAISEKIYNDGKRAKIFAEIVNVKLHITKSGEKMCFLECSDESGTLEAVVFPSVYSAVVRTLKKDNFIFITGTINRKDDTASVICKNIIASDDMEELAQRGKLCVKVNSGETEKITEIINIAADYPGRAGLVFYLNDKGKMIEPKKKISVRICRELSEKLSIVTDNKNTGIIL